MQGLGTYRLGASFQDGGAVEVLVVLYGVAVLDDALGATVGWRCAVWCISTRGLWKGRWTYSSDVSALGWI
jgi:hypothetical protein